MSDIPEKRCTKCKEEFSPTTEFFYRQKEKKDGLTSWCKKCIKAKEKARYDQPEVREQKIAHQREYRSRPGVLEHKKAVDRVYRHRPEYRERRRNRYHNDPEWRQKRLDEQKSRLSRPEVRARTSVQKREYRSRPEVQERRRERHKEYYSRPEIQEHRRNYVKVHGPKYYSNPDVRERMNSYYKKPEQREKRRHIYHNYRARKRKIQGIHTATQIQEQLKRQRYRCYYAACGNSKFPKVNGRYLYHVEHTFPLSRVADSNIPANDISYLVLACEHCNASKGNKYPWEWVEGGKLL